jgi:hypothetical protein
MCTHLLHPFIHLIRRTLAILNIMKQEALYAVYFHKKIVQYVLQSAGFLCPPNPLGNSSYCFRFRGRADWESLHCLMAWIWDVPWHCQCDLPLTNVKTKPQILNAVPYSVGCSQFCPKTAWSNFHKSFKNQPCYLNLFFLTLREQHGFQNLGRKFF